MTCWWSPQKRVLLDSRWARGLAAGNSFLSYPFGRQIFQFFLLAEQTSIPGVSPMFSLNYFFNGTTLLFCDRKFSDRLKRCKVICSRNSLSHCLWRECKIYAFNNFLLALWDSRNEEDLKLKNRYSPKLYPNLKNCTMIQRITSQSIVQKDFPIFEGMEKFYYRHSAKKCTKYPFDSRVHLKTVRRV